MGANKILAEIFESGAIAENEENLGLLSGISDDELRAFRASCQKGAETAARLVSRAGKAGEATPKP